MGAILGAFWVVSTRTLLISPRDDGGLWPVKGVVNRATHISNAHCHPTAEHLIVFLSLHCIRIVERRPVVESEGW